MLTTKSFQKLSCRIVDTCLLLSRREYCYFVMMKNKTLVENPIPFSRGLGPDMRTCSSKRIPFIPPHNLDLCFKLACHQILLKLIQVCPNPCKANVKCTMVVASLESFRRAQSHGRAKTFDG